MLKAALALRDKVLPPSVQCERPNPGHRFRPLSPLRQYASCSRGRHRGWRPARRRERVRFWRHKFPCGAGRIHSAPADRQRQTFGQRRSADDAAERKSHALRLMQGAVARSAGDRSRFGSRAGRAFALGADSRRRRAAHRPAAPPPKPICARPNGSRSIMRMRPTWRTKSAKALKALAADQPAVWKALRAQGIFRGTGPRRRLRFCIRVRARST